MTDYLNLFENLFDWLVLGAGLVVIVLVVLRSSRPAITQSPGVMVSVIVWLAVFVFALFLIFGSWGA